jgi:hypothetical protein
MRVAVWSNRRMEKPPTLSRETYSALVAALVAALLYAANPGRASGWRYVVGVLLRAGAGWVLGIMVAQAWVGMGGSPSFDGGIGGACGAVGLEGIRRVSDYLIAHIDQALDVTIGKVLDANTTRDNNNKTPSKESDK